VGRLFLKLYFLLAIVISILVLGMVNLETIFKGTLDDFHWFLSKGSFHMIDIGLTAIPREQWPDFIKHLNNEGGYRLRLQKPDEYEFSDDVLDNLNENRSVFRVRDDVFYGYKRIRGSSLVLEFPFGESEYRFVQQISSSTFELIELDLLLHPQELWHERISTINTYFGFPVKLLKLNEVSLTGRAHTDLLGGEVAMIDIGDNEYDYRLIKGTSYVIRFGPIKEPISLGIAQSIFVISLAIFFAIVVLFWVYPLSRDINRLEKSSNAFGQGDFNARATVAKRSPLSKLTGSFNAMADRIQNLISSHKELTNAASHELRTPIARLKFGIEMIRTATDAKDRAQHIEDMNADIDELDNLVAEILTYAHFDRDRPKMAFKRQQISVWLMEVVDKAKRNMETVSLSYDIESIKERHANFEPKLMARAIGNLLQNAHRYAKSRVEISVTLDAEKFSIYVDDDGAGIPEKERENVFDAFKRLDASRDRETGGFGLGLAIVLRIVQWHNGVVSITDSPLGGARFVVSWSV